MTARLSSAILRQQGSQLIVVRSVNSLIIVMAQTPPPYGKPEYWDERFKTDPEPYDWLEGASILDADINDALQAHRDNATPPRILHIGSGTSKLSLHLRDFVKDPAQIQHADFSAEAVEWGRHQEKNTFGFEWDEGGADKEQLEEYGLVAENLQLDMPMMKWTQTSLLSLDSVVSTLSLGGFQIIVDKSCCDAIACASWVTVPIPYYFKLGSTASPSALARATDEEAPAFDHDEYSIHPINLLAIHLALVVSAGARWLALSFSKDRWPFFPDDDCPDVERQAQQALPKNLLDAGFPDPAKLWRMIKKENISKKTADDHAKVPTSGLQHWIYVLERTEVKLEIRGT
ncbi:hypothetical protein FKW77_000877 [Venturia effusa]|uniref:Methyltransferase domain-containing protein n=1 Tax=Venturia effusa TaxID=50376 RepID=A0A517LPG2_9PEZI|nr:hypothetical protein FKW77_000877 [Venturia effusa]